MASKHGETESINQALSSAAMKGTAILITVTMTFIILTGPANIVFSITTDTHPLLSPFLYLAMALNHGINGFLYTIVGSKFRKELIAILCCNKRQNQDTERGRSRSTQISTVSKGTEGI